MFSLNILFRFRRWAGPDSVCPCSAEMERGFRRFLFGGPEALRPSILAHIRQSETQLTTDISEADVLTCKKVLCQMLYNVSEHKEVCKKNE